MQMVSLAEAAALAYFESTGERATSHALLGPIARLIARRTRLFSRPDGAGDYALVMPDEIEEGDFMLGGAALDFADGRPRLSNLALLRHELASVLEELRELLARPVPSDP